MIRTRRAIGYGILIWAITFGASVLLYPVRGSSRPLFESVMPVVLAAVAVLLALRYFSRAPSSGAREGLLLGLIWLAVNVAIDLPLMLTPSPMQMTFPEYVADIGVTYLLFPLLTVGVGAAWARGGTDRM